MSLARNLFTAPLACSAVFVFASAQAGEPGLLFSASADRSLRAEAAGGEAAPLFADKVRLVPSGARAGAIQADDDQILAWGAPGNMYAQRGTLSFFWRSREPVGRNPFPIFRVGYPDHTSWDMQFLRVDWNGRGYDAFVTDANLARTRVSFTLPSPPKPDAWTHLAVSWDETQGLRLYVNGVPAARRDAVANYDNGLFAFGPHSRIISGYQVQSAYDYQRGGDVDEVRTYDHMLADADVAALARHQTPTTTGAPVRALSDARWRREWWSRFGFDAAPPYLAAPATRIRKVEFADARDIKQRFWKGTDGIRETTWPGVYNRSRLPGRNDYFTLPDWNVYSVGGRTFSLTLPDEPWNRVEIQGAADGQLTHAPVSGSPVGIGSRAAGRERTTHQLGDSRRGGLLRFDNRLPESPIQEIAAYNVTAGAEPAGAATLSYTIRAGAEPDYPTLDELQGYIRGRFVADERATAVALPEGAPQRPRVEGPARAGMPLVHVLIPADFREVRTGQPVGRFSYGWENLNGGLDGVAIDLPAMKVAATHNGLVPLNIRIKDPLWPDRDLLDVNVSVKPGEARTLWLDTRDRLLPNGRSLYLTLAGAGGDFRAEALDGARIRLVFKDRRAAAKEHVEDRFEQIRGGLAFFVEEQPNNRRLPVFERWSREVADLLRVDPDHVQARNYWNEQNGEQPYPAVTLAQAPAGVPLWAFRQIEDFKQVQAFVDWWIEERQIANGEFGGGLSDDTDMLAQWPPLALMGYTPERITDSQRRMLEAVYANGMLRDGLNTIMADELHSYEEGVNAISQAVMLNWGSPRAIERAMETARHYTRLSEVNLAGHRHFVSSYFNADTTVRESVWQWQKQPTFLILHPGLQLVDYNGSPAVRKLILELADGYLAHGKPAPGGTGVILPPQIYWPTDAEKMSTSGPGGTGAGPGAAGSVFWAAYRWTGDRKYLQPLLSGGPASLVGLGPDVVNALGAKDTLGRTLVDIANGPDPYRLSNTGGAGSPVAFARHVAWQTTGDTRFLEALYAREIETNARRLYMMTEGHLWTDRVQIPSEMLQRARLGGVASRRNQVFPGHVVAWRFAAPATANSVAILLPEATQTRFKVIAFNMEDRPVDATLIGADVAAGTWRVRQGQDAEGDGRIDGVGSDRSLPFERTSEFRVSLAPMTSTLLEFELATPATPTSARPDVGIDPEDVRLDGRRVIVTAHSLGAVTTPAGRVLVEDASGRVLAEGPLPAIAAPLDLRPKTAVVRLVLPGGARSEGARVRLVLDGDAPEVTRRNNAAPLPGRGGGRS